LQFAAKGKEAIFSILEAVNTIFVPILKFITQSSEGIIGLALLIGLRLTKQALPELGKAFQEALSFDKYAKEAKFQKAFDNLSSEFKKSNSKLLDLKAEQTKILTDVFDPKVAAFTKFTDQMGGSMRRVASGVFGTESKPVDVSKYKDVESVNTAIEKSLLAQVKGAKDKEATLQKIVALGLVEKTSTVEKITLDEKGRTIGAQMYQLILQRQAGLTKELAIQAEINALQQKSTGLKLQLDEASLNSGASSLNKLSAGTGIFSKTMDTVNSGWTGFKVGLGTSSILAEKFALAMQGGTFGLRGFLKTLPAVITNIMTAGAGLGFFAAAAATAGATIAGVAATIAAGVSLFLGPLLLAYTAWQLFGDAILGLIPGYTEAKLREEELQKSLERGREGAIAYLGAMSLITKEREAGVSSFAQYLSLLDREEKVTLQRISALDEEIRKVEEAKAAREEFARTGIKPPTKGGEIDTQSPEYIQNRWNNRRKIVEEGATAEKLAIDNIILGYGRLAKAQDTPWYRFKNTEEIQAASLAVNKLEKAFLELEQAANKAKRELAAPWVSLETAAKSAGDVLEKAARKELKFPGIDAIKEVALNDYAGQFAFQLMQLKNTSTPTEQQLLAVVEAMESADKQAIKAGSSTAIFAAVLDQLKAAGDKQAQLKKLPELFAEIAKNADTFYNVLAKSTANQDAVKKSRKTVELLKTDEDNKIKMFDKTAQQELEILKRTGDLSLKLIELRRTGRDISEGQALAERLTAVQAAEAAELKLIEDNAEKRKQLVIDRVTEEYKTYQKNLKLAGKDTDLVKKATESYTKSVNDLMDAQELYSNLQEKRKGEIKDGAFVREAEIVEGLKGKIFELKKSYKEAAEERERSLGRAQSDFKFTKSKSMMTGREAVVAEATRDSTLDYEAKIREATKVYMLAQKDADDAIQELGDLSPVTTKLNALAQVQYDNLDRLRAEVIPTSQALGVLAGQKFDFESLSKYSEGWMKLIDSVNNLGDSFTSAFGEIGTSVAGALKSLADFGAQTEQNQRNVEFYGEALRKAKEDGNVEDQVNATKSLAKATSKQQRDEVSGIANIAGSSKKLFKEKTAAYKVLDTVEKVAHITRLAMDAKELAIKLGFMSATVAAKAGAETAETGLTFAGTLARLPAYAAEIYGKTIGQLGPIAGPIVATGLVAAMFSLFGKGGKSAPSFTATAEQRQEVQGTAMDYDKNGNKVQVRRGVFGDENAKSESIAKSLEIIRDNSIDGLEYDNKMLAALQDLSVALGAAAKGLYGITGLRKGSLSGIVEGTNTKGGVLGIGGLFSKSVSTSIVDSGLQLKGSFYDLAKAVTGTINTFEIVSTTVKKSGFLGIGGSSSTSVNTLFKDLSTLDKKAFDAIADTFNYAADALYDIAKVAGVAESQVTDALKNLQVDRLASLRDLTGEEFTKELGAVVSSVLDEASLVIFSTYEKYAQFSEGMLETVVRVVDSNKKVAQAIKNIGSVFDITKDYTTVVETINGRGEDIERFYTRIGETAFDISEALVLKAGGIEEFLSQAEYFRETFLASTEQTIPIAKAVDTEMQRLGRLGFKSVDGIVDTREEFAKLVQGLDLSTVSGREAYQSLMNVAEGFDKVITANEKLKDGLKSMQMRILELTGTSEELLKAQRDAELGDIDPKLRSVQQYIYALEDVKTAQDNLTKAKQDELNTAKEQQKATEASISGLKNYISSILKFKSSLLLGAASPLSPGEKYKEAKSQFDDILATATKAAVTPEEKAKQETALGQLEGASTAFLEASKTYNASSTKYQEDFNKVQLGLTTTSTQLSKQLTTEEKTLAATLLEVTKLDTLNTSVLSVADAVYALNRALGTAGALKNNAGVQIANVGTSIFTPVKTEAELLSQAKTTKKAVLDSGTIYGAQGETISILNANNKIFDFVDEFITKAKDSKEKETQTRALYNALVNFWKFDSSQVAQILNILPSQVNEFFKPYGLPAFAMGTNFVPEDMIAQIHQGERIIPAGDNAVIMQSLNNRDEANRVLVSEIQNLRSEVKQLREQQAKETGNIITANFDAQQRAAEQIEAAVSNTAQQSNWSAQVRDAVKLK
jgi:hypothetical protein